MLKPGFKVVWLAALRSGKYQKGRGGFLRTGNGYCVMGVACDLIDPNGWRLNVEGGDIYNFHGFASFVGRSYTTSIGLSVADHAHLINMSDRGDAFAEIASEIEMNL